MPTHSTAYADFAEASFSWEFIERPALNRALPDEIYNGTTRILDIGSGSGRVVGYHLERGASEAQVTGIEPDIANVKMAQKRFSTATFISRKVQDTPLDAASFDIVTAHLSLRYLDNGELITLTQRIKDTLCSGGLFFLLDVHPARYGVRDGFDKYFQEGKRQVDTPWGSREDYYYRTIGTYVQAIASSGLTILGIDECPIADGASATDPEEYARYNVSPARFAILATKII